jgi:cell shape-determining protein MreC
MGLLTLLVLFLLFAVLYLIIIAQRVEKGIASVVRILDAPREELEMLENEMQRIHKNLALARADKEDIERMEEIREKITRIERRMGRQRPSSST